MLDGRELRLALPSPLPFVRGHRARSHQVGRVDTDNVENPLADYTLIYLPTANGDVFLGDATPVYDTPAMNGHPEGNLTILHKGFGNAMLALDWMFRTYPQPNTVAVMGWSTGALASPFYTHIVARHYPDGLVTHFADGGGAYHLGEKLAPLFQVMGHSKRSEAR